MDEVLAKCHQQVEEGPGLVALWRKALSHGEMLPVWKGEKTQSRHKESHVRRYTDAKGHDVFLNLQRFQAARV